MVRFASLPFDRIRLLSEAGREVSPEEFLALPLHKQVEYVLGRKLEFRSGSDVVPRSVALQRLWELEAEGS